MNIKPLLINKIFSKLTLEKKTFAMRLRMGPIPKESGISCSQNERDLTCTEFMKEFLPVSIGSAKLQITKSKGRRTAGDSRQDCVYSLKSYYLARMDKWLTEAAKIRKIKMEVFSHGRD